MEERIQKLIASAGLGSRRAAEEMILRGEVTVNGQPAILGAKADPVKDHIKVRGRLINSLLHSQKKRYFLVNKPRGYLSSVSDPKKRPLVSDLLPAGERRGLHPVGRLDFNSEGLIILTNDGDLTLRVSRGGAVPKVYRVKVKGLPSEEQIARLRKGISLAGRRTAAAKIELLEQTRSGTNSWYEVTLREGRNQQIRKMFDSIGHSVLKLHRVRIGHIEDRTLPSGAHRELASAEVQRFFKDYPETKREKPSRPKRKPPRKARK